MELKYVLLIIIKILISVPGCLQYKIPSGAVEPINNKSDSTYTLITTEELQRNTKNHTDIKVVKNLTENVPDPMPLVVPGYNLPETIFNKGKPFYLEKDPLTGNIDFDTKISSNIDEDFYQDEEPMNEKFYDKSEIDRKDGSIESHHRPSDVNQLTPNFHDFLNLPVKYNPDKYLYPLISSSYANTNIQGNVHRYHNHKDIVKTTSSKPAISPTYYSPTEDYYELPKSSTQYTTTTTTLRSTTVKDVDITPDMMVNAYQPNLEEDFEYYEDSDKWSSSTPSTTKKYSSVIIGMPTTTKKTLSLFEQLFGDYEDTERPMKHQDELHEVPSTTPKVTYHNSHAGPVEKYEEYSNEYEEPVITSTTTRKTTTTASSTTPSTITTTKKVSTTTKLTPVTEKVMKVTSLPLGENHVTNIVNQPIIVATQNLRDKLNSEKVKPPGASNIHIAPDQDTVSFVVGHHQSFDGASYSIVEADTPYDSNPFRPLYGQQPNLVSYDVSPPKVENSTGIVNIESSVAIGTPLNVPVTGQVINEPLDLEQSGSKIVFPDETEEEPPAVNLLQPTQKINDKEVLHLNSQPMYHQLPSDLTPPKEKENSASPPRSRPPWDPRPGHFHSGKPEYVRPPRPQAHQVPYKRIDHLPNILPQFRPNIKTNYLNRQPLLERPNNRPIGFFEKLQPPPPPKNLHNLRKVLPPEVMVPEEKGEPPKPEIKHFQKPPEVIIANRRIGNLNGDVETLQMIQAKKNEKVLPKDGGTDKPLYVVYPVNTPPIKLDATDSNVKESVVIGTRAELPLPPSKIQSFDYEQNPILNPKDRNDAPILKPHLRPLGFPIKSDFPYPLERPDPSLGTRFPEVFGHSNNYLDDGEFISNNQWNTVRDDSVVSQEIKSNPHQISVTLKTRTDKPIAVAYTPTQSVDYYERYSEQKPGIVDNEKPNSEFTVSAVMHTHPQYNGNVYEEKRHPVQDFQAPFHASDNIDSLSQGWSVVRENNKSTTEEQIQTTNLPLATSKEFDIENFKPMLESGFKPIYHGQDDDVKPRASEEQ